MVSADAIKMISSDSMFPFVVENSIIQEILGILLHPNILWTAYSGLSAGVIKKWDKKA
jgi:hypothetical protein